VQRLTELGQVVAKLVHEVNQPLTAIRNYLNALRRLAAGGNRTGMNSALDRVGEQIDRTSEIVQRIRDYTKKRDMQMQSERL
jgi:two-component system sensor kinase FixL